MSEKAITNDSLFHARYIPAKYAASTKISGRFITEASPFKVLFLKLIISFLNLLINVINFFI
jgi:hypothetical protein